MNNAHGLRKLSRTMQHAIVFCAVASSIMVFWSSSHLLTDPSCFAHFAKRYTASFPFSDSLSTRAILGALDAVEQGILLVAFYCAWRMFGAFAAAEPLSAEPPRWMYRGAIALGALFVSSIAGQTITHWALTMWNPPGQVIFALCLGINDILIFVIAGILLMTSRVLSVAEGVRAEQRAFV